jgi:hypothetical protein
MAYSIETEVINQLNSVAIAGLTPNIYTQNLVGTPRETPYILIEAKTDKELVSSYTGIFELTATITLTARADVTTNSQFDQLFQKILEQLYRNPSLSSEMTTNSATLQFYIADVISVNPTITSKTRTWSKAVIMDIKATTK